MGVLIERGAIAAALAGIAGLAGCYSPELPECVHACATPNDCSPSQTCGSDRLCASPEVAGHCDQLDQPDGPTAHVDARDDDDDDGGGRPDARVDARPHPDAEDVAILRIDVEGRGKVKIGPPIGGDCHSSDGSGAVCSHPVAAGTDITLTAEDGHGWEFVSFAGCSPATAPTCVVTVGPGTTTVTATFVED